MAMADGASVPAAAARDGSMSAPQTWRLSLRSKPSSATPPPRYSPRSRRPSTRSPSRSSACNGSSGCERYAARSPRRSRTTGSSCESAAIRTTAARVSAPAGPSPRSRSSGRRGHDCGGLKVPARAGPRRSDTAQRQQAQAGTRRDVHRRLPRGHPPARLNPVTGTDKRRENPLPALDYYEVEEVEALARACEAGEHRTGAPAVDDAERAARELEDRQDADAFRVLFYTGLRLGEVPRFAGRTST